VLVQVILVFGIFAAVHARELFGNHALVRAAGTVTYAAYLHAGFAQLLFATVLAVVTVVSGHALLRPRVPAAAREPIPGGRVLVALEVTLLGLVGIALASCWQRSTIYEIAYGYTYLRLAVRFVEGATLGVILLTILKGTARAWRGYGVGVAAIGLATVLVATCFNADLYIARENVARAVAAKDGSGSIYAYKTLDLGYLEDLSRDALPVLDDPYFASQPTTASRLEEVWNRGAPPRGWRSFRGIAGRLR
jgi:two-component system, OmpR family, sensor histidine kinase BaeS